MRRIFLKQTSYKDLPHAIGGGLDKGLIKKHTLYVRCNSKGTVNWDKQIVYTGDDLVTLKNFIILKAER